MNRIGSNHRETSPQPAINHNVDVERKASVGYRRCVNQTACVAANNMGLKSIIQMRTSAAVNMFKAWR